MRSSCGGAPEAEQSVERLPTGGEREVEVVPNRVVLEHGRLLELAADAELGDRCLVEAAEVDGTIEIDVALVGACLAGDHVHHRRLAGAVGADDGAHLAGLDHQRQLVQRPEAVEGNGDAVEVEKRVAGFLVHRPTRRPVGWGQRPRPCQWSVWDWASAPRPPTGSRGVRGKQVRRTCRQCPLAGRA